MIQLLEYPVQMLTEKVFMTNIYWDCDTRAKELYYSRRVFCRYILKIMCSGVTREKAEARLSKSRSAKIKHRILRIQVV